MTAVDLCIGTILLNGAWLLRETVNVNTAFSAVNQHSSNRRVVRVARLVYSVAPGDLSS
jgi:adenylylsulfate kinase-like enzyme